VRQRRPHAAAARTGADRFAAARDRLRHPGQGNPAPDIATVLDTLFESAVDAVGKPGSMMDRSDRMDGLATLDQQGAFEIRRSVELVSGRLGISKVTAYASLDELRKAAS